MNTTATTSKWVRDKEQLAYAQQGYLIKEVLPPAEVDKCKLAFERFRQKQRFQSHQQLANIQFIQQHQCIEELQPIVAHAKVVGIAQALLGGGRAILDGASLLNGQKGICYQQGWHRDVLQLDESDILDSWFSPAHFHNNIQINLALNDDECLWLIPGSHHRGFTENEHHFFAGSKKMSPVDNANTLQGKNIHLNPGQAVFYNNNLIHRGFSSAIINERITIQLGFHSSLYPPTYHFGVLNAKALGSDYLSSRVQAVKNTLLLHLARRYQFPELDRFHSTHQAFIHDEFFIPKT